MKYLVLFSQNYLSERCHGLTNDGGSQRISCLLSIPLSLSVMGIGSLDLGIAQASELSEPLMHYQLVQQISQNQLFGFSQNFDPPGDGRPDTSRGSGARRGSCEVLEKADHENMATAENPRIRAMMPSGNFGLTLQSHPTIFINFDGAVPPFVVLRFEDEAGNYRERVTLPVDPELAIQGFALPSDLPPLEVGKNYRWFLLVACDGQVNPNHPLFSGWVQRVAASEITSSIQQQPWSEQISWYTDQGYWYDTVMTLYETLQSRPEDDTSQAIWAELLDYVDRE